jgi:large subunit ribosomal protein L10
VLTRGQKEEQIRELKTKFSRATSVFVAEYRGLDVHRQDALRRKLRAEGKGFYEYRVTKNTILRRAAEGSDVAHISAHFKGPTAVAISYGDPVGLAKILVDYAKENEIFKLRGAVLDGRPLGQAEIATLATLPSLDALRGKLLGLLLAPASQLARLLAAPGAQLARVIEARRKALAESGDGPAAPAEATS